MEKTVFELQKYASGAYILTEGEDILDRFFIIKTGRVERGLPRFLSGDRGDIKTQTLGVGDLFGVISCLAKRPRMETVIALEETSCIMVRRDNLQDLIQNNTEIAIKIMRYFSQQLRYYNNYLAALTTKCMPGSDVSEKDDSYLFDLGEYYFSRGRYYHSAYAFYRYLEYKPQTRRMEAIQARLSEIKNKLAGFSLINPLREENNLFLDKDQPVFLEGETGHELYVIQEGKVQINRVYSGREILLNVLGPGEIFGEMAILEDKPRSSNAFAAERVKLLAVTKQNFKAVVQARPVVAVRIFEVLADRLWLVYRQIANQYIRDPEIKVYDALYTQILKSRVILSKGMSHVFEFNSDDILKFTGMTMETGKPVIHRILQNDKSLSMTPEGKFACADLDVLAQRLTRIKRELEMERKNELDPMR